MMGNLDGYKLDDFGEDRGCLPAGTYEVALTTSEMRETKKRNGRYLYLVFDVLSGEHRGRKLFSILNLENPSADAAAIAQQELARLCRAAAITAPEDSSELHDIPISVKVVVQSDEGYGPRNQIKDYQPLAAATPQVAREGASPW